MIASSLASKVYQNKYKEIFWFPVQGLLSPYTPNFQFPISFSPLHWHGETFDLPVGAVQLARSEVTENQAFQVGKNVIAIQFHPEATREILDNFVFHFKKEIVPAKFIQSEEKILNVSNEHLLEMEELVDRILRYLCSSG